jgi:ferredoxin
VTSVNGAAGQYGPTETSGANGAAAGQVFQIDRIACDGRGVCAELLPELIALDDWGYPIFRPGTIPNELLDLARRAVEDCPVLALRLRAADPASR